MAGRGVTGVGRNDRLAQVVVVAMLSRYADGAWGQPDILRSRWFWTFVIGAVALLLGAGILVLRRQARV